MKSIAEMVAKYAMDRDCALDESLAASELPPSEQQGRCERSCLATCSLLDTTAWRLAARLEWEANEWRKLGWKRVTEKEHVAAKNCQNEAARLLSQLESLRQAVYTLPRQKAENTNAQPTAETPDGTK